MIGKMPFWVTILYTSTEVSGTRQCCDKALPSTDLLVPGTRVPIKNWTTFPQDFQRVRNEEKTPRSGTNGVVGT